MQARADAASVAVIDGGEVLLIQRARLPSRGYWTLPGGRLEEGEDAVACAVRELYEELGLRVSDLLPVTQLGAGGFVLQVFATRRFAGDVTPSDEISAVRWTKPSALGELAVTPGLPEVLAAAFRVVTAG